MIEIEKKFQLQLGDEERLLAGAFFQKEVVIQDVYWDTPEFAMTGKDWWLRKRDGVWELKMALHKTTSAVDRYRELEIEEEIRKAIGLNGNGTFEEDLVAAGYEIIIPLVTTRKKYRSGEFGIDIDATDFGFMVAEIELMVVDDAQMDQAADQIMQFASDRGLFTGNVRGKILEFLFRFRPGHYRALCDAGVARA